MPSKGWFQSFPCATTGATGGGIIAGEGYIDYGSYKINVNTNETYEFSIFAKANPNVGLYLELDTRDENFAPLFAKPYYYFVPTNTAWNQYSYTIGPVGSGADTTWPDGTKSVNLTARWTTGNITVMNGDGQVLTLPLCDNKPFEVWFDDVFFGHTN